MSERAYYENYADLDPIAYTQEKFFNSAAEMARFNQLVQLVPEDTRSLLDVGSGQGIFVDLVRKDREILAVGLDRSRANINVSRRLFSNPAIEGRADRLPFPDRAFDTVTCFEVIEHLPFQVYERALAELERVAIRWILVSVPFEERRVFTRCPYCGCRFHPSYHMRSFNEDQLGNLFHAFQLHRLYKMQPTYYPLLRDTVLRFKPVPFPPFALCPTCGFRKDTVETERKQAVSGRAAQTAKWLFRQLWSIFPKEEKYRWSVTIYNRG